VITKPGCFGVSICYNAESEVCIQCTFRLSCLAEAKKEYESIKDAVDASFLEKTLKEMKNDQTD